MSIVNLTIYNDGDFIRLFSYQQTGGDGIDLTGSLLTMKFRKRAENAEVDLVLSSGDEGGIVITDAVNGKFTVTIDDEKIKRLGYGDYAHALIWTRTDEAEIPIWHGTATIKAGAGR